MPAAYRELYRGHWIDRQSLTVAEARAILDAVPESALMGHAKLNREITRVQAMEIFRSCLASKPDDEVLRAKVAENIGREFGGLKR